MEPSSTWSSSFSEVTSFDSLPQDVLDEVFLRCSATTALSLAFSCKRVSERFQVLLPRLRSLPLPASILPPYPCGDAEEDASLLYSEAWMNLTAMEGNVLAWDDLLFHLGPLGKLAPHRYSSLLKVLFTAAINGRWKILMKHQTLPFTQAALSCQLTGLLLPLFSSLENCCSHSFPSISVFLKVTLSSQALPYRPPSGSTGCPTCFALDMALLSLKCSK